ncbi:DedA family protein [Acetobacteraceae bacterium]|nr:DedA family protein [Acetobacteraceae bacterium]
MTSFKRKAKTVFKNLWRDPLPCHLPSLTAFFHLSTFLEPYFQNYGYWVVGVTIFLESIGIPLPAETLIIAISLYAASTHALNIFIIAALTILGTILGNIIGYGLGRKFGSKLLEHYGKYIGLDENRLLIGRYLCHRWGRITIIFSRYFAFLRLFASLIAGTLQMKWLRFLVADIVGSILWGLTYSVGTYYFGEQVLKLPLYGIIAVVVLILIGFGAFLYFIKKEEQNLLKKAQLFFETAENSPKL